MLEIIKTVRNYTMLDVTRLVALQNRVFTAVKHHIEGDVVELGVCKGGSAAVMADQLRNTNKNVWLYDTFKGIPESSAPDGSLAKEFTGAFAGTIQEVKEVFKAIEFPENRMVIREGLFEDTFKQELPEKISVLHIDADWYESVLLALKVMAPRVVKGGFIILDDFGHWAGCRIAFYEYCKLFNVAPVVERIGYTQLFWQVGKESNAGKWSYSSDDINKSS